MDLQYVSTNIRVCLGYSKSIVALAFGQSFENDADERRLATPVGGQSPAFLLSLLNQLLYDISLSDKWRQEFERIADGEARRLGIASSWHGHAFDLCSRVNDAFSECQVPRNSQLIELGTDAARIRIDAAAMLFPAVAYKVRNKLPTFKELERALTLIADELPKKTVTKIEMCQLTGMSPSTIRRMTKEPDFPAPLPKTRPATWPYDQACAYARKYKSTSDSPWTQ